MPNEARLLDYLIGGKDNFAADREAAKEILRIAPEIPMMMREGRKFLARGVRYILSEGIRQFVDIGCGLPTRGSTHQILAAAGMPEVPVVYVDNDPVVIAHSNALIDPRDTVKAVLADLRETDALLDHPTLTALVDLDRPVGVVMNAVLASIADDEIATVSVKRLVDRLAPGSLVLMSHAISDTRPAVTGELARVFQETRAIEGQRPNVRTLAEVTCFLDGLDVVAPGIVPIPAWRPGRGEPSVDPETFWAVGAVARKP
ncbi:SAM-dependent methyltransferase [Actinocorallia longicatena]|uniref:SAM-dependent methyltransferase n=1 Tax=Actinocorallia longicatena TaxID=111803 RepID=A0ABP6QN59_9ACTN